MSAPSCAWCRSEIERSRSETDSRWVKQPDFEVEDRNAEADPEKGDYIVWMAGTRSEAKASDAGGKSVSSAPQHVSITMAIEKGETGWVVTDLQIEDLAAQENGQSEGGQQ